MELTYGGGKTHILVALRHVAHASVKDIQTSTLESIDKLLRDVSPDLGLKR